VSWEQVGLVFVDEIVANPQSGAGWWPDPCLRVPKAFGVAGVTTALWFTVYAPPHSESVPHTFTTTVILTPDPSITARVSGGGDTLLQAPSITFEVEMVVFGFSLPARPALMTAFNLDEGRLGKVYGNNGTGPASNVSLAAIKLMWEHTGCSNPFAATVGEQPLWVRQGDGGARDMYTYCQVTRDGTATAGQRAVCGTVPARCSLQHLPGGPNGTSPYDPSRRAGHAHFVQWAHWLLANFSLNPGTIYSPPVPFSVAELAAMVPLGLNSFTAFPAEAMYAQDPHIAAYVRALDTSNLSQYATTYGFDESDKLDEMEATFQALKDAYPSIKTFTTAHMCGARGNWRTPFTPCYGTCPGPSCRNGTTGQPVQDPTQIKRRHVDYMCPILDWVQPANVTACEAAGLQMWMYTSLEPWGTFCNLRLDNPLHEPRLLFWQTAQLRLSGFLYWDLNAWENTSVTHTLINGTALSSPYIDPRDWTPMQTEGSRDVGDGKLTYAGIDGPVASIRLHAVRDGIEDYG